MLDYVCASESGGKLMGVREDFRESKMHVKN